LTELMVDVIGPLAQPCKGFDADGEIDRFKAWLAPRYGNYRKASIYAGSNEIQRNILAKAALGL
jgi:alkylation response protein AidB-like acyl-CoA dehydrogenase